MRNPIKSGGNAYVASPRLQPPPLRKFVFSREISQGELREGGDRQTMRKRERERISRGRGRAKEEGKEREREEEVRKKVSDKHTYRQTK